MLTSANTLAQAPLAQAQTLARGGMPVTEIAKTLGCSRRTVYKALAQAQPAQVEAAG